jgi:hypothetical protein
LLPDGQAVMTSDEGLEIRQLTASTPAPGSNLNLSKTESGES